MRRCSLLITRFSLRTMRRMSWMMLLACSCGIIRRGARREGAGTGRGQDKKGLEELAIEAK
eukprot:361250-Chlamydomonas_euryale.AAC.12